MSFHTAVNSRRLQLGLSLQQLADQSGVSPAMLSEVERGRKSPTLRVAAQIANGLGCAVSELLNEQVTQRLLVRRRAERQALVDRKSGIERQSLAPTLLAHGIEVVWYVVPPRSASGTFAPQRGGVLGHLTVVRGVLECRSSGEQIRLNAGDSLDYPGEIPHEFRNPGHRTTEFILVVDASHVVR
jgi:transcriptional regulator with XRE-family HTH domain